LTAGWFGLVRAVLFGGAATLAVTGIWAVLFPVLSRMDRFPHHREGSGRQNGHRKRKLRAKMHYYHCELAP